MLFELHSEKHAALRLVVCLLLARVEALTAALAQSQAANERLQQQCSSQASQAPGATADMQALAAELAQLRDENARLAKQGLQQPGSPVVAAKPSTLPSGRSVLSGGLAAAGPASDASCKVSSCACLHSAELVLRPFLQANRLAGCYSPTGRKQMLLLHPCCMPLVRRCA
jgi:hypothetical protein